MKGSETEDGTKKKLKNKKEDWKEDLEQILVIGISLRAQGDFLCRKLTSARVNVQRQQALQTLPKTL